MPKKTCEDGHDWVEKPEPIPGGWILTVKCGRCGSYYE